MKLSIFSFVGVMALVLAGIGRAEDAATADLRRQVEELQTKLSLSEKAEELLVKEIEDLRKENAKLKGTAEPVNPAAEADQFRVGVVWVGEARINGKTGRWAVSISERDGQKFKGAVAMQGPDGKKAEVPVSGTAPSKGDGLVVLESPLVGRAKVFMRGRLSNGEIALALSATNRMGDKSFGSATLRPKN